MFVLLVILTYSHSVIGLPRRAFPRLDGPNHSRCQTTEQLFRWPWYTELRDRVHSATTTTLVQNLRVGSQGRRLWVRYP